MSSYHFLSALTLAKKEWDSCTPEDNRKKAAAQNVLPLFSN